MEADNNPYVCPRCTREVEADAGLHPFLFSRKASPYSLGAPDYTLFRASGEYDGHIVNEFKVMVPIQEVVPAIDKLRELGFLQKE